jgi:hypothetical protein
MDIGKPNKTKAPALNQAIKWGSVLYREEDEKEEDIGSGE